ncbi:MAG: phosphoribosyl-AMP cyclohydrolase [Bifidobacteriaceae bacterium]|nr:phosphoribosyl-AMP cyclohydrolase [Bifidobacteriaceae bacterium]
MLFDNSQSHLDHAIAKRLKHDDNGLIVAVVQSVDTNRVLMVGYMNDEALYRTISTGKATFWSRSRQEYWCKGDTSGHVQYVKKVEIDCDGDAVLLHVEQIGSACHTGEYSCFDTGGEIPLYATEDIKE